jgi:hypothetical protein
MGDLQGLRGKPVRADSGVARSVDRGRVPRRSAVAFRVKASASVTGLAAVALDEDQSSALVTGSRLLSATSEPVGRSCELQSGVQIGVQFEQNWGVRRRTRMALQSHINTHAPPLCPSHNPKVAGSNPAPATKRKVRISGPFAVSGAAVGLGSRSSVCLPAGRGGPSRRCSSSGIVSGARVDGWR